ncbi:chemotaxis response regulator protein-glutamate methylesterase, partial [bacterium]|nr:chemotaxis response regulator protein-glutamate methylesterase [bacterium]
EVVGVARDAYEGRDLILKEYPDLMILDIQMPRMSGLEFTSVLMEHFPLPIIILSSVFTGNCEISLKALELGALDVLLKPTKDLSRELPRLISKLHNKIIVLSKVKVSKKTVSGIRQKEVTLHNDRVSDAIIAIGASTGGTEALAKIFEVLPDNLPPIVITQHMPPVFTNTFAQRLNRISKIQVHEARDGDILHRGMAIVAPGGYHLMVRKRGSHYQAQVKYGPQVSRHRPAVNVMFNSLAECAGKNTIGILLTGMGADGAAGLLNLRNIGAKTLCQDEESCIVFGMPREAIAIGAAQYILPLQSIPQKIIDLI